MWQHWKAVFAEMSPSSVGGMLYTNFAARPVSMTDDQIYLHRVHRISVNFDMVSMIFISKDFNFDHSSTLQTHYNIPDSIKIPNNSTTKN